MIREEGPVSVLIATDSSLIGDGLSALLGAVESIDVVGRASDHEGMLTLVDEHNPDVLIMSVHSQRLTTMAMLGVARRLREKHPNLGLVVISDRGNGFAVELLRSGASRTAFLLDQEFTGFDAVLSAVHEVRAGQSVLSPSVVESLVDRPDDLTRYSLTSRELEILEQMAHGFSNSAIASSLKVTLKVIEKCVTVIYRKLNLGEDPLIDRRVTAASVYMRSQAYPFAPAPSAAARLIGNTPDAS